jgi:hypothetical protein
MEFPHCGFDAPCDGTSDALVVVATATFSVFESCGAGGGVGGLGAAVLVRVEAGDEASSGVAPRVYAVQRYKGRWFL